MNIMLFIRRVALALFVLLWFTGCAYQENNVVSNARGSSNKLLIVSNVSPDFYLYLASAKKVALNNTQVNPLVLDAAASVLSQRYLVVGKREEALQIAESNASQWKRTIVGGFFQGLVGNNRSLDGNLLQQLRQVNAQYSADFIVLIYGEPRLNTALIKSNTGPVTLIMDMYLLDIRSGEVLAYQDGYLSEDPYSAEANANLYQVLQDESKAGPYKGVLMQWINSQAPRLSAEVATRLMNGGS